MNLARTPALLLPAALLLSACAGTRGADLEQVSDLVEGRAGVRVRPPEDEAASEIKNRTYALLNEGLSEDAAVQVALLNNPGLQATLEELGVAKADLVEAGLLENPRLEGGVGFAGDRPGQTFPHFALTQNVTDALLMPLRRKAAAARFEEAKLRVSGAVLELVAKVKTAYYGLQAAEQTRELIKDTTEAAEAAAELAERQRRAGNINALSLAFQQALLQEARVELARSETALSLARDELGEALGVLGLGTEPKVQGPLEGLPVSEVPLDEAEALALAQRLELAALRQRVAGLERSLALAKWGSIPEISAGVEMETEPEDTGTVRRRGPELELRIPLFDRNQAGRARARAQLRQGRRELAALESQARKEVRAARARMTEARKVAEYHRDQLIPLRGRIVEETQRHYNFMLLGVYPLLDAKREELHARRDYIEALRDYWTERADLERAVSGRLTVARRMPERPSQPEETPNEHHEQHQHGEQK